MASPELEQHVSADGNPDQRRAAHIGIVHDSSEVGSVLFHGGWTVACGGVSVAAKIRKNYAVTGGESFRGRQPELVIGGERVQKNYGRPFAQHAIDELR